MAENEIQAYNATDELGFNIPTGNICTIDLTTDEGKIAVTKALNGSSPLKERMNETLNVVGIVTTPGVRAVSGNACTNNYIILDDGDVLFSQSDGVTRSLKIIATLWSAKLANGDALQLKCIEQRLNNGNTLKTIIPA